MVFYKEKTVGVFMDQQILKNENEVLEEILNFEVKEIDSNTRFWMVRTKKGYFYDEFIANGYVALAWNNITKETVISEQTRKTLCNQIITSYPEIKRPNTVINKCNSFMNEVKEGDIIVIPSKKSRYITFAYAGSYYEEEYSTVEIERSIIKKIEDNDAMIHEVSCPYRKRRNIDVIMTVDSSSINYNLYRAISNYHGLSNLDRYAKNILSTIYNVYSYKNDINFIYNVKKEDAISPRLLSGILYGTSNFLCGLGIEDESISTQININSPGPIDFNLIDVFNTLKDCYLPLLGILVAIGGGSIAAIKVPGLPKIIKDILILPDEKRKAKAEAEGLELENIDKKIELYEKIKSSGINPEDLNKSIEIIAKNAMALQVEPLEANAVIVTQDDFSDNLTEDESEDE